MKIKKLFILLLTLVAIFSLAACKDKDTDTDTDDEDTVTYYLPSIKEKGTLTFNENKYSVSKDVVYDYIKMDGALSTLQLYIETLLLKDDLANLKAVLSDSTNQNYERYTEIVNKKSEESVDYQDKVLYLGYKNYEEYVNMEAAKEIKAYDYIMAHVNDKKSSYYLDDEVVEEYFESTWKYENGTYQGIIIVFNNSEDFVQALKNENIIIADSKFYKVNSNYSGNVFEVNPDSITDKTEVNYEELFVKLAQKNGDPSDVNALNSYEELINKDGTLASNMRDLEATKYTYMSYKLSTDYQDEYILMYKKADQLQTYNKDELKDKIVKDYVQIYLDYSTGSSYLPTGVEQTIYYIIDELGLEFYDRDLCYFYDTITSSTNYKNCVNPEDDADKNQIFKFMDTVYTADNYYEFVNERNIEVFMYDALELQMLSELDSFKEMFGENYMESDKYTSAKSTLDTAITLDSYSSYMDSKEFYQFTKYSTENYDVALDQQFKTSAEYAYYIENLFDKTVNANTNENIYSLKVNYKDDIVKDIVNEKYDYNVTEYSLEFSFDTDKNFEKDDIETIYTAESEYKEAIDSFVNLFINAINNSKGESTTYSSSTVKSAIDDLIEMYEDTLVFADYSEDPKKDTYVILQNLKKLSAKVSYSTSTQVEVSYRDQILTNLDGKTSTYTKFDTPIYTVYDGSRLVTFAALKSSNSSYSYVNCKYTNADGESLTDELNPYYNTESKVTYAQIGQALYEYLRYTADSNYTKSTYYSSYSSYYTSNYSQPILTALGDNFIESSLMETLVFDTTEATNPYNFTEMADAAAIM